MKNPDLQLLIQPTPAQWGLRGDPDLWQELGQALAEQPLASSPAAADALLASLYLALVGEAPATGRQPFVARYAHGGMSSGRVSADFWLTQGFPLLKSRLLAPRP
ncbi:hypothetical protein GCM10027422_29600 [Hymenobacter arcticus]